MSRAATGDVVAVRPTVNIYTTLVVAAVLVQVLGVIVVFMRARTLGVKLF